MYGTRTLLLAALLTSAGTPALVDAAVTTKEIEEALTCQCGCGLTVHSCNHLQCGSGIPLKQEVVTLVGQGLGRDEILARFRDKFGEKILAAPTTEGFNLVAWVLPFLAVGVGAGLVGLTVRRWSGRETASSRAPELDATDRARLDDALRQDETRWNR